MWVVPGMGFAGMVPVTRLRSLQIFLLLLVSCQNFPSSFSGLWEGEGITWPDNKRGVRMEGV